MDGVLEFGGGVAEGVRGRLVCSVISACYAACFGVFLLVDGEMPGDVVLP